METFTDYNYHTPGFLRKFVRLFAPIIFASMTLVTREPQNEKEMEAIMDLRWRVLRAPWGEPRGTESDDSESESFHGLCMTSDGIITGSGRLQKLPNQTGQIRYMCVAPEHQGRGQGQLILNFLETVAKKQHLQKIILNARQNAVPFYLKNDYEIVSEGPFLFNCIPHKFMTKKI